MSSLKPTTRLPRKELTRAQHNKMLDALLELSKTHVNPDHEDVKPGMLCAFMWRTDDGRDKPRFEPAVIIRVSGDLVTFRTLRRNNPQGKLYMYDLDQPSQVRVAYLGEVCYPFGYGELLINFEVPHEIVDR